MYRIICKKAHGDEVVAYRDDMRISDLFNDIEVLSVCIATEKLNTHYDELQQFIKSFPTQRFDGHIYRIAEFEDIEEIKRWPCVRRVEFIKVWDRYALFSILSLNSYGDDEIMYFAFRLN